MIIDWKIFLYELIKKILTIAYQNEDIVEYLNPNQ